MPVIREEMREIIQEAYSGLAKLSDAETGTAPGPGRWSRKQILGHLIDSAANNHQRLVRAQLEDGLTLPDYDQEAWVRCQDYSSEPWKDLVWLWRSFNLHLLHVISRLSEAALLHRVTVGTSSPVTLRELVEDYLRHLRHHLGQILIP